MKSLGHSMSLTFLFVLGLMRKLSLKDSAEKSSNYSLRKIILIAVSSK